MNKLIERQTLNSKIKIGLIALVSSLGLYIALSFLLFNIYALFWFDKECLMNKDLTRMMAELNRFIWFTFIGRIFKIVVIISLPFFKKDKIFWLFPALITVGLSFTYPMRIFNHWLRVDIAESIDIWLNVLFLVVTLGLVFILMKYFLQLKLSEGKYRH